MAKRKRKDKLGDELRTLTSRARQMFSNHKARAKKKGHILDYNSDDLVALAKRAVCCGSTKCPLCGEDLAADTFSMDHRVPISRGGLPSIKNLWVTHVRCNKLKWNLFLEDFLKLRDFLRTLPEYAKREIEALMLRGVR